MNEMVKPKKKKSEIHKPAATPYEIVKQTNYVNSAAMVRTLYHVYGWREKRIQDFFDSYIALMQEIFDKRSTVRQFIKDTEELTGFNVKRLLDDLKND